MAENQELANNHWRIEEWFSDISPETLKQFKLFHDELVKFNKTVSLVPPKTVPMADVIHFSDSILASRVITRANNKISEIYDLSLGNGFPGIIFALLNPHIKVNIVEADQRKSEFLNHVVTIVKVPNVEVMNIKADTLKEGSVQFVITRGFASISKVILLLRRIVPKGGVVYHLKGEQWGMEVSEIPIQLCSLWSPGLVGEYRLPLGEMKFSVIKTDKIA